MLRFLILFLVILQATVVFAQSSSVQEEIAEKARRRLYNGGVDEQPLQVQRHLVDAKTDTDQDYNDSDSEAGGH